MLRRRNAIVSDASALLLERGGWLVGEGGVGSVSWRVGVSGSGCLRVGDGVCGDEVGGSLLGVTGGRVA